MTDTHADPGSGQRILVTGGAGFIGSHLVEQLVARGAHVTIVDNLSTGSMDNLASIASTDMTFVEASVADGLGNLEPSGFDSIYHLAAAVGVRLVVERPIHTIETNVHETSVILDFAARNNTPILIASTSEVYGKSTNTPFHEDDDVVYGPTIFNRWSYACSKAIDEFLALAYHAERNVPVRIARFFNTVGPRQVGEYGMVLPRFVEAALNNQTIDVYGDGQQSRCFCDVRDVVELLPRLMANEAAAGRVFNVGSDQPISIRALAEKVIETLGSKSQIRNISYEDAYGPNFDDLRHRRPDLTRVQETIGFNPRFELTQTILDLAQALAARKQSASVALNEGTSS